MASPAHLPDDALPIWVTTKGADTPGRLTKRQLVDEVKRLIGATVLLDVNDLDEDDTGALAEVVEDVSALADRLTGMPALPGSQAAAGGDDARLLERSGISGHSNPVAAPLQLELRGDRVFGWAEYPAQYEGPPGCLHGGFVAAAFDDLLGVAQLLSGQAGYTGTLTVRMRRPTPLFRRIDYEAWVDRTEGRKIIVRGTASHDDELLAEAEGIFISPTENNPLRAAMESGA
ncbi:MAG: PaaI family thioesterase [Acidimicrobiales bacterium]